MALTKETRDRIIELCKRKIATDPAKADYWRRMLRKARGTRTKGGGR